MLPELLRTYRNRFVAIHGGRIVGVGASPGEAADIAIAEVGPVEMYVDEVTDTPRLYRIRGPRIARSEAAR